MNLEEIMKPVEDAIEIPCKYQEYIGKEDEYVVYNETDESAVFHEDNIPAVEKIDFTVHYFVPKSSENRNSTKKAIKKILLDSGITVTDITTLYEQDTKILHTAFTCWID